MDNVDIASLVYLLGALILFGSGAMAAREHAKAYGARGPGAFASLLIWGGVILLIVLLYRASTFWDEIGSFFN